MHSLRTFSLLAATLTSLIWMVQSEAVDRPSSSSCLGLACSNLFSYSNFPSVFNHTQDFAGYVVGRTLGQENHSKISQEDVRRAPRKQLLSRSPIEIFVPKVGGKDPEDPFGTGDPWEPYNPQSTLEPIVISETIEPTKNPSDDLGPETICTPKPRESDLPDPNLPDGNSSTIFCKRSIEGVWHRRDCGSGPPGNQTGDHGGEGYRNSSNDPTANEFSGLGTRQVAELVPLQTLLWLVVTTGLTYRL